MSNAWGWNGVDANRRPWQEKGKAIAGGGWVGARESQCGVKAFIERNDNAESKACTACGLFHVKPEAT
jgi:hypothetical protein